jgi:hypothetical protein
MKITTFDPLILSPKSGDVVKLFEELGFEITHDPVTKVEIGEVQTTRMKNESGFHIDVANIGNIPNDRMLIRMNVDNFEEAYDIFIKHGFKNTRGDNTLDTKSAIEATMVSPSGFSVALVKHIK